MVWQAYTVYCAILSTNDEWIKTIVNNSEKYKWMFEKNNYGDAIKT